ncbi:MAG: HAMP domain-containing histidine kinase [Bacilli bacterium]|nr:HAMP domain-containing histidine kinase [Bacilli bacterium]
MNIRKYLKDKLYVIIPFLIIYFILILMFMAFKINFQVILASSILLFLFLVIILTIEYIKKKSFYTNLLNNIEALDKAYLVLETLDKPNFYDGELLCQALYEINKSMNEFIKTLERQMLDFKEYIELWIHEVKIPIVSITLMAHNHKDKFDKKTLEQLKKIENYVEQVLYYVRSENAEHDYLINKVSLDKVISNVALKNKDNLLANKITLKVDNVNYQVFTDSKWLEYIINQIVNNSIKYKRNISDAYIKIDVKDELDKTAIIIMDNGIGIPSADLPKIFEKSFTGYNGRIKAKSTGMGLNICKNLCEKLGHKIYAESEQNKYTKIYIVIAKNKFYLK